MAAKARLAAAGAGVLALSAALVAAGYAPAGDAFWVADDFVLVDGQLRATGLLRALGLGEGTPFLRPALSVSFWLDALAFGHDPVAFHWHSFALHALAAALLGVLAVALTGRALAGTAAAAVFATCPLHPEAVTWISARGYPLGACWTLLALLAARAVAARGGASRAAAAGGASATAVLAIEPAIPLPVYAPLLLWGEGRRVDRRFLLASVSVAVAVLACIAFRLWWLGGLGGYRTGDGSSRHLGFEPGRVAGYLLAAFDQLVRPGPRDEAGVLPATRALALLALLGSVRWTGAGARWAVALAACSAAALSIVSGWATLDADLAGVRYLYFASLFPSLGVGLLASAAWRRGGVPRWVGCAALVIAVAAQLPLLRSVNERWARAGELSRRAIAGLQERHAAGARHFLLHGAPAEYRGAHAVPWGLDAAAVRFVGADVRVEVVADAAAWEVVLANAALATPEQRAGVALGEWDAAAAAWRWR